jgi:dephospho-CoA kinase
MLIIGLTGSIGSGKSTVAKLFAERGVPVIDADIVARAVTEPHTLTYDHIVAHFGVSILQADGRLNRAKLREIIFTQPEERRWLESLLHPEILKQMQTAIAALHAPYCIAVIPLLLEVNAATFIQRILVVDVPETMQLERAVLRDKSTHEQIKSIIKTQVSREVRLAHADDIINNAGTLDALIEQVDALHQQYLKLAKNIK